MHAAHPQGNAPAIISQRRPAEPHPTLMVPDTDWEPWNEAPPALGISRAEPPIPAQPVFHDQKVAVRERRYSHLPLIAEDMKKPAQSPASQPVQDVQNIPVKKRTVSQKKGVLGFLKK
jgi:hypothetical protein